MSDVYVIGVGMTPFGRFLDKSVKDLTQEVVAATLADAGLPAERLDAAFFANSCQSAIEGQHMVRGQIALRAAGIDAIPIANVENACASGGTSFHMAYAHVKAGLSGAALAIGVEKMHDADKSKSFAVFNGAWDVHDVDALTANLMRLGEGIDPPPERRGDSAVRSVFMDVYAALAKFHMKRFGTTERQLAAVAAKNHRHSVENPLSQYREDMSVDQVMAARMIAWPLTLPMCAPISDGAAAAILVRSDALSGLVPDNAVKVCASVLASGSGRRADEPERHICRRAAAEAYERAGLGPLDIDAAEVHDASAFGEILQIENLGFCPMGEGGPFSESGATRIGGSIPVNPSGGLESKGHPIGATGLGQIYELVQQLRGRAGRRQVDGARFAIAENGGGLIGCEEAAACITILGR